MVNWLRLCFKSNVYATRAFGDWNPTVMAAWLAFHEKEWSP
jgi:hypothetical protein